eukprot:5766894-Heterocapsa_arctica.AAC.1
MASLVAINASSTIGVAAFCMRTLLTAGHPVLVRILIKGLSNANRALASALQESPIREAYALPLVPAIMVTGFPSTLMVSLRWTVLVPHCLTAW